MGRAFENLKVLLIQARGTEDIEHQEQVCFQERCQLPAQNFVHCNVVRDRVDRSLLNGMDAVMIGGAGEFSACSDYQFTEPLLSLIRHIHDARIPLFGACWGHQMMARALGGEVIHDSERAEFGCREVNLTPEGKDDALFRDFPSAFMANMGHHDRVRKLPPDGIELARNESQPNQAFMMAGTPLYGTQFHSELDAERERERLITYRDLYIADMPSEEAFQEVVDSLLETSEVDHLLHDFLVKFAVKG